MTEMICIVTPTIDAGIAVRWYFADDHMAGSPAIEPVASASRNGVRIGTYLHLVPADILAKANEAYALLKTDRHADLSGWATHRRERTFGGPLVPIERPEVSA